MIKVGIVGARFESGCPVMNLMFGLPDTTGLTQVPVLP